MKNTLENLCLYILNAYAQTVSRIANLVVRDPNTMTYGEHVQYGHKLKSQVLLEEHKKQFEGTLKHIKQRKPKTNTAALTDNFNSVCTALEGISATQANDTTETYKAHWDKYSKAHQEYQNEKQKIYKTMYNNTL